MIFDVTYKVLLDYRGTDGRILADVPPLRV